MTSTKVNRKIRRGGGKKISEREASSTRCCAPFGGKGGFPNGGNLKRTQERNIWKRDRCQALLPLVASGRKRKKGGGASSQEGCFWSSKWTQNCKQVIRVRGQEKGKSGRFFGGGGKRRCRPEGRGGYKIKELGKAPAKKKKNKKIGRGGGKIEWKIITSLRDTPNVAMSRQKS